MRATPRVILATVSAAALLVTSIVLAAQQAAPPAPAPRPLVPLAASSILRDPATYYGENVSMMVAVEAILSKTAFTVDQDRATSTGKDLLVLAPNLTGFVQPKSYVTVQGEVFRFEPAEVARLARTYTLDLSPELIAKYQGRPAVLATAVINEALVDVAKRVPPPMTPAEVALDRAMKEINPAMAAVRGGLETPDAAALKVQIATLKRGFTEAETFFKTRGTADATGWAGDALKFVTSMETATAAAKWDDLRTATTGLGGLCATCHTPHRERQDDGTFRVRGSAR
jgi:cytochrome c556